MSGYLSKVDLRDQCYLFLSLAAALQFDVTGIAPESKICSRGRGRGRGEVKEYCFKNLGKGCGGIGANVGRC